MKIAVGHFGISLSDFWDMSPQVFFLLWEAKRPRDPGEDYAGRLTERDCAELYAALEE